ncbi:hypothetical protein HYALB_00008732 [Hymenoscyphus albidus]|uniref:Aromatic amino acid beta-eliminating lyase/threonine aldolase domain-containing protein n=1 Tax=Hymenoscyphus albidus TaxID=595503 RepID=A0A9N9LLU4_9HELO|nr:hypothetical protein HYALB_00008732 [Hymenoscyphus albidus]
MSTNRLPWSPEEKSLFNRIRAEIPRASAPVLTEVYNQRNNRKDRVHTVNAVRGMLIYHKLPSRDTSSISRGRPRTRTGIEVIEAVVPATMNEHLPLKYDHCSLDTQSGVLKRGVSLPLHPLIADARRHTLCSKTIGFDDDPFPETVWPFTITDEEIWALECTEQDKVALKQYFDFFKVDRPSVAGTWNCSTCPDSRDPAVQHAIISNGFYDTTSANVSMSGFEQVSFPSPGLTESYPIELVGKENPFKGDLDILATAEFLRNNSSRVQIILLTITNNWAAAQPVSMANVKATSELAREYCIPLFSDACRFAENAKFVQDFEAGYNTYTIPEIMHEMFSCADGFTISLKKDGLANMGGALCFRDQGIFATKFPTVGMKLKERQIVCYGNDSYRGMSGRDMMAATWEWDLKSELERQGIHNLVRFAVPRNVMNENHFDYTVAAISQLYKKRHFIPGMRIVRGKNLRIRHFSCKLETVPVITSNGSLTKNGLQNGNSYDDLETKSEEN